MVKFTSTILRFDRNKEKTGWSYVVIDAARAKKLNSESKVSFRVKGRLDKYAFEKVAILPIGDGNFILPVNGTMRKAIGKQKGDKVTVEIEKDERKLTLSPDLMICLADDPVALKFFKTLPNSHQSYFSKWIESAKTSNTRAKRIVMAVIALSKRQGYPEMLRSNQGKR